LNDTRKKVLIVDDEGDVAEVAKNAIESDDIEVVTTFDGLSAIDEIASVKPDLILLDVMMPTVDGFALCKRIKDDPATEDIIVVLYTAANEPFIIERIVAIGADDYVMKPVDSDRLRRRVRALLGLATERS